MPLTWQTCDICGRSYAGIVSGDCGDSDAKHRAARNERDKEDDE